MREKTQNINNPGPVIKETKEEKIKRLKKRISRINKKLDWYNDLDLDIDYDPSYEIKHLNHKKKKYEQSLKKLTKRNNPIFNDNIGERIVKEWLELGPVPSDEVCEQVGLFSEYNPDKARKEALVYQKQLETQFKDKLNLVKFGVKLFQHDFGTYYEVVVYYDSTDQEAVDAAFEIESSLPENWSEESLLALSKKDNPCGNRKKKNPDANKNLSDENLKSIIVKEFNLAFGDNSISKEDVIVKFLGSEINISLKKPNNFDINDVIEVIKDAIFSNKLAAFNDVSVFNSSVVISNLKKKNPIEKNGKLLLALEKINETFSLSVAEKQVLDVLIQFLRKQEKPNGKVIIKDNRRSL